MAEYRRAKRQKAVHVPEPDRPSERKRKTITETGKETQETPGRGKITPRIMVQSGGIYILEFHERTEYLLKIMLKAAKEGYDILNNVGTAVDAVEKTIFLLEESEYFNAGYGSLLNKNREVECDAMIMDGNTLETGAVMGARHFKHPVSISRKIMEESPHCAFSGEGALKFAQEKGFDTCQPNDLVSPAANDYIGDFGTIVNDFYRGNMPQNHDTVTAIALDSYGHFACATSTGGIPGKMKGRVGDAPLVGCGGYANEFGAAATSGHGEALMKMTLAREVVYNMEKLGQDAQESTKNAVERMERRVEKGWGSAIAIDVNGKFGKATNAPVILWAQIADDAAEYGHERKINVNSIPHMKLRECERS